MEMMEEDCLKGGESESGNECVRRKWSEKKGKGEGKGQKGRKKKRE